MSTFMVAQVYSLRKCNTQNPAEYEDFCASRRLFLAAYLRALTAPGAAQGVMRDEIESTITALRTIQELLSQQGNDRWLKS